MCVLNSAVFLLHIRNNSITQFIYFSIPTKFVYDTLLFADLKLLYNTYAIAKNASQPVLRTMNSVAIINYDETKANILRSY